MKRTIRTRRSTTAQPTTGQRSVVQKPSRRRGAVAVEYVLLITVVGIGALVGLASVRDALVDELDDLANAIMAIT